MRLFGTRVNSPRSLRIRIVPAGCKLTAALLHNLIERGVLLCWIIEKVLATPAICLQGYLQLLGPIPLDGVVFSFFQVGPKSGLLAHPKL